MARRLAKFRLSKHPGRPLKFDAAQRGAVEKEYNHKLTETQWKKIADITSYLTLLSPAAASATGLRKLISKFATLQEAAKSLRSEFTDFDDAGVFTPEEIYWGYFSRWRTRPPDDEFAFLEAILGAVIKYSEFALLQMENPKPPESTWRSPGSDYIWSIWVNGITKIIKDHNMPYAVRKDSDKNKTGAPSPFVVLIRELQRFMPKECRKFAHSDDALAQGISRARRAHSQIPRGRSETMTSGG